MNEDVITQWINECWLKRPNPFNNSNESLLIFDSACCHLTEGAKEAVKKCSKLAVIPGGLTKILQLLDVSVNKSFKNNLRRKWEHFIVNTESHTFTSSGRLSKMQKNIS